MPNKLVVTWLPSMAGATETINFLELRALVEDTENAIKYLQNLGLLPDGGRKDYLKPNGIQE